MTIFFGTGFEPRSSAWMQSLTNGTLLFQAGNIGDGTLVDPQSRLRLTSNGPLGTPAYIKLPVPTGYSELWFTIWVEPQGTGKGLRIEIECEDGGIVGLRKPSGVGNLRFDGFVEGVSVATGGTYVEVGGQMLEVHIKLDVTAGILASRQTDITGAVVAGINYSGNTVPIASDKIKFIRLSVDTSAGDYSDFDDLTLTDDGFPGDIRYSHLSPNGDSSVTWSRSAGATNWSLVDERPPVTTDSVNTSIDSRRDLYDLENYARTERPLFVALWHQARSSGVGASIIQLISSGGVVELGAVAALTTTYTDYQRLFLEDPNTGAAWTVTALNALKCGQDSLIPGSASLTVPQVIVEIGYLAGTTVNLGSRPLAIDLNDYNSVYLWVAIFNAGAFYLQRYDSYSLVAAVEQAFGAASEAQVDARTYFIFPHAPAYFTLGDFSNYVYVCGRYDNAGTAEHIARSVDGGLTFTDIGDASWTTERIGAMWTEDSNTIYVILNGSNRLWRTTNGGAAWSNINSVPFDVEHRALSRHANGRVLISRNVAGAVAVSYLDSPYTGAWVDITDALPISDGKLSVIWIS